MFDFLKKRKKEEQPMATVDEKEIAKAKRDIAEKGTDSQTEKDRIDESVGEQERRSGNENSQDAKDRVDESEGAKRADEKRERDHREDHAERMARIEEKLDALTAALNKLTSAEKAETKVEEVAKEVYGLGNGVFADADSDKRGKQMSKEEIRAVVNKLM